MFPALFPIPHITNVDVTCEDEKKARINLCHSEYSWQEIRLKTTARTIITVCLVWIMDVIEHDVFESAL